MMFKAIKEFFFGKSGQETTVVESVSYKVEPAKVEEPQVKPPDIAVPELHKEPVMPVIEPPVVETPVVEAKPKRARSKGKFKADDKATAEVNEAWVDGKSPAKKKPTVITTDKKISKPRKSKTPKVSQ